MKKLALSCANLGGFQAHSKTGWFSWVFTHPKNVRHGRVSSGGGVLPEPRAARNSAFAYHSFSGCNTSSALSPGCCSYTACSSRLDESRCHHCPPSSSPSPSRSPSPHLPSATASPSSSPHRPLPHLHLAWIALFSRDAEHGTPVRSASYVRSVSMTPYEKSRVRATIVGRMRDRRHEMRKRGANKNQSLDVPG